MKIYYDFHIHTGLSPCGDEDMTPNNIVNMSLIKELNCIAITDHNSCGNVEAVMKAAEGTDLLVIPGMEAETAEEVHMVCLFPTLENAVAFDQVISQSLPRVKNKVDIFGRQIYFDHEDQITGYCDNLLITAANIGIYEMVKLARQYGGIAIPAHVDRSSYSVVSNLGFMPDDLGTEIIEISRHSEPLAYFEENGAIFNRQYFYLQSSDAHYLQDINERIHFLEFDGKPNVEDVIEKLLRIP